LALKGEWRFRCTQASKHFETVVNKLLPLPTSYFLAIKNNFINYFHFKHYLRSQTKRFKQDLPDMDSIFFSKLPRELRDMVYQALGAYLREFSCKKFDFVADAPRVNLLLVNKQFKAEYEKLKCLTQPRVAFYARSPPAWDVGNTQGFLASLSTFPLAMSILSRVERVVMAVHVSSRWGEAEGEFPNYPIFPKLAVD
jgi:hypothetical protein